SHGPPAPPPAVFCPPGVPFGPVHFTEYPLKPEYKNYAPEKILELDPLAHIQSAVRYNCQGPWIFSTLKLFRGKFNYLPAYNIHMEPPVPPKPMPASLPDLPTDHTGKLFGIVYITLTGVIDTIIPAAGPWSWVRKSVSYLFKLAPLLWWALAAKTLAQVTPENNRPAARDWIPDSTQKPIYSHIPRKSGPSIFAVCCTSKISNQVFTVEALTRQQFITTTATVIIILKPEPF
ncbi:hypothetical protein DSO57_1035139, partial [Entomophthora muscae]